MLYLNFSYFGYLDSITITNEVKSALNTYEIFMACLTSFCWKNWICTIIHLYIIYLWRKVICLFCFILYRWDLLNWDASDRVLGLFQKLLRRRGGSAWFHDVWTCDAKVLEYWMIFSLKIKLNHSWKFRGNWNVPLVLLERSWWAGFNGIYLVRSGFRMWEILILSDFYCWNFK